MRLKVGGVQKEKKEKDHMFWKLENFFFLVNFSLFIFLCISKMIFRIQSIVPVTF
jgi:hypothetical protein